MELKKLPKEQELYLYEYFNEIGFNDLQYLDQDLLLSYLTGNTSIRLEDYKGDCQNFYEDIWLSITCSDEDKQKYLNNSYILENLFNELNKTEYFELLYNVDLFFNNYYKVGADYSKQLAFNRDIEKITGIKFENVYPD